MSKTTDVNQISETEATEYEQITNLGQFVNNVVHWHLGVVQQLEHMVNVPIAKPGDPITVLTEIRDPSVPAEDGNPLGGFRPLTTAIEMNAFVAGVRAALDLIVELPFKYVPADADENTLPEYSGEAENTDTVPE